MACFVTGHKMRLQDVNNIKLGKHINTNLIVYDWNISKISLSSEAPVIFCTQKTPKNGVFCDQSRVGHKMRLQNVNNIKHNQEITSKSIPFVFSPSYWNI